MKVYVNLIYNSRISDTESTEYICSAQSVKE